MPAFRLVPHLLWMAFLQWVLIRASPLYFVKWRSNNTDGRPERIGRSWRSFFSHVPNPFSQLAVRWFGDFQPGWFRRRIFWASIVFPSRVDLFWPFPFCQVFGLVFGEFWLGAPCRRRCGIPTNGSQRERCEESFETGCYSRWSTWRIWSRSGFV